MTQVSQTETEKQRSTIQDLSDEVLVAALAESYPRAVLVKELVRRYNETKAGLAMSDNYYQRSTP